MVGATGAPLIDRLRTGDNSAFEAMVRENSPRMLATARRFLPDESDAADAVQEAFFSAFKGLGKFDGGSSIATWLHRILINACLMKLRTRRRKPERSIEDLLPVFGEDGHQASPSVEWNPRAETVIEGREAVAVVRRSIQDLPEDYRTVIMLRDFEGLSTEDTAAVLEISPNAVKTRLHRARQALRSLLDPYMRGESL